MNENFILDKNNRPILIGDILKIFHFIGTRRKKYFMYKQVIGFKNANFYEVSHLDMKPMSYFMLHLDNKKHDNIEIIQSCSYEDFENRKKIYEK